MKRYEASGDLQLTVGDSTVSRVCAQVSDILAAKVPSQKRNLVHRWYVIAYEMYACF
ncbi:hypothetical protein DPMN_102892 [Dreissena polymorpha]|uniref:Uncharacterized protein n=1 Tax=Dreissena polymorpha TaxID=45954 RepID=A0A9D4HA34_DREPO|nr:hypothetical protein DPMN_102892 [Dreissena polymorpha]